MFVYCWNYEEEYRPNLWCYNISSSRFIENCKERYANCIKIWGERASDDEDDEDTSSLENNNTEFEKVLSKSQ